MIDISEVHWLVLSNSSEYLRAQAIDTFPLAQPITRREMHAIMIQIRMNSLSQMSRKQ